MGQIEYDSILPFPHLGDKDRLPTVGFANEPSEIESYQQQRIESSNLITKSTKIIILRRAKIYLVNEDRWELMKPPRYDGVVQKLDKQILGRLNSVRGHHSLDRVPPNNEQIENIAICQVNNF
jgi:hypothetical protein